MCGRSGKISLKGRELSWISKDVWKPGKEREAHFSCGNSWAVDLATEMNLTFSGTVRGQTYIECVPWARRQAGHCLYP